MSVDRTLFVAMLREEWRLHTELFGGVRFAAFPVFVAVLTAAGVLGLQAVDVDVVVTLAGMHALVFAFGLQTGSVGLVGRDAIENLLGEVTLLVFSGRTLPLSRRRLLAHFLFRDLCYYTALFLAPLAVAMAPVALGTGALSITAVPLLFVSLTATFALGLATTLAVLALSARGVPGGVALLGTLAVIAWLQAGTSLSPLAWTPYGFVVGTSTTALIGTALAVGALSLVGILGYQPSGTEQARVRSAAFRRWQLRLGDERGLVVKQLFDVERSAGGLWKVVFSGGILFAVSAALIVLARAITRVQPSPGVAFGAVLSLSAFTTYNWLTSAADVREYRSLPLTAGDVFDAYARTFAVLGPPAALLYYVPAVVVFGPPVLEAPGDAIVGVLVLLGFQTYLFGLTVRLAGDRPNEFLFDSLLFGTFFVAVAIPMIPVLVVGVAVGSPSPVVLLGVALVGVLVASVGLALLRSAGPFWERRLQQGD